MSVFHTGVCGFDSRRGYMYNILVIDREEPTRQLLKDALAVRYFVEVADSCQSSKEILKQGHIDLLIIDVWVHDFDATWITEWVKNRNMTCKIIFITEEGKKVEDMHLADSVLTKPFDIGDVINISNQVLKTLGRQANE